MNKKRKQSPSAKRGRKKANVLRQHKKSVVLIVAILTLLTGTLAVNSIGLYQKNKIYKQQEAELKAQIEKEKERTKEVEEYEEYVKTDEYVKDVAEDKLGLVDPNEIIFKPEK